MHTKDAQILDDQSVRLTRGSHLIRSPNSRLEPDGWPIRARHGLLDEWAGLFARPENEHEIDGFGDVTEIRVADPTEEALGPKGGGYETRLTSYSNLVPDAGARMRDAGVELARAMKPGQPPQPPAGRKFVAPWSYGAVSPEVE